MMMLVRRFQVGLFGSFLLMGHACAQPSKEPHKVDVDSILARPLFEPDRQPKGRGAVQAGEPQVVGIAGRPGGWRAIIRTGASGSRGKVVAVGDKVGDWSVAEISVTEVILRRGQSVRRLAPVFVKHPVQTASQPQGTTTPVTLPVVPPTAPISGQPKPTFHFDPASGEAP
ncbi:hypothetical protein [Gluconobacter kondonii]|uniref:hypothetical protein n=1 Tax=Gluconobacter kondonii TaxID=941463 RepID=UPI00198202E9|nr:hypothetical protein [Gluconobacter kondonii]MBN3868321.1 hypothetical protein [Gluconobacter kondonii]